MQLPAGRAIDRYGARGVGIASLLAIAVGNVIALTFREFWVAVGARALMGLGTGAGFISGADYVRAAGGEAQMQGFYGGATLGATGLAVAIVPQLQGWRAPYWTALALVLPVLAVLPFVPSTKRPPMRRSHVPVLSDRRPLPPLVTAYVLVRGQHRGGELGRHPARERPVTAIASPRSPAR